MKEIDLNKLAQTIKELFIEKHKYQTHRTFTDFKDKDGNWIGDYLNDLVFELKENEAPIYYHVFGPFELISKKAPQSAIVWQEGKTLLEVKDFIPYLLIRTAIMTPILLKELTQESLENKKILYFGTGTYAKESLRLMKFFNPEISEVDFINTRNEDANFVNFAKEIGANAMSNDKSNLAKYDIIICHTSSQLNVLSETDLKNIKTSAFIFSFVSSSKEGELAKEFYNENLFNIVIDSEETATAASDLKSAINEKLISQERLITLTQLFNKEKVIKSEKPTIFRSCGTSLQNLAILKMLIEN